LICEHDHGESPTAHREVGTEQDEDSDGANIPCVDRDVKWSVLVDVSLVNVGFAFVGKDEYGTCTASFPASKV